MARRQKQRKRKSTEALAAQRQGEQALRDNVRMLERKSTAFLAGATVQKALGQEDQRYLEFVGQLKARHEGAVNVAGKVWVSAYDVGNQIQNLRNRLDELRAHAARATRPGPATIIAEPVPDDWPERGAFEVLNSLTAASRQRHLYASGLPPCIQEAKAELERVVLYRQALGAAFDEVVRLASQVRRLGFSNDQLEEQVQLRTRQIEAARQAIDGWVDLLQNETKRLEDLIPERDCVLEEVRAMEATWVRG